MRFNLLLPFLSSLSLMAHAAMPPELPHVYLDTTMPIQTGRVINVPPGGSIQAAINEAVYGDTIVLQAGVTYRGKIVLPEKTGTGWIVIQSSELSQLPEGKRVLPSLPSQPSRMARIVAANVLDIPIITQGKAHHYRLSGIEVASEYSDRTTTHYALLSLGTDSETDPSRVPHDIIIDRCYLHGTPTGNLRRAIALNSARTAVIDSYISDCHEVGADSQAIGGWNGPGPYKIVNNFLEGAGENVIFGGAAMRLLNTVPSDIEIRYNHIFKPLSWKIGHATYAGIPWSIKNLFELKNAMRVLFENNVLENNWSHAQTGFGILYNGVDGITSTIEDVTTRYNYLKNSDQGFNISAHAGQTQMRASNSILLENNLFELNGGISFQVLSGVQHIRMEHQTVIGGGNALVTGDTTPVIDMTFQNNLMNHGPYGVFGSGKGTGNATMAHYFPGGVLTGNVLVGGNAPYYSNFPGNFFPANWNAVKMTDMANHDYSLQADSPYKSSGTDGVDIGVDMAELLRRISGVTDGSPTIQPPPPNNRTTDAAAKSSSFSITVFPNPWRKDRHTLEVVNFDWPGQTASLKIFTASGYKVRSYPATASRISWDLRTESGDKAASGLYLYAVERSDGQKTRGKFAVIK